MEASFLQTFSFRPARDDQYDANEFCKLFNTIYARRVDRPYYRWQFFGSPFPSFLSLAVAKEGNLAGCYGFHLIPADPGRKPVAWAVDIMIAHQFQGRGLFRALSDYAVGQLTDYQPIGLCVMANARAYAPHVRGLGWKHVRMLRSYVCPSSVVSAPRTKSIKVVRAGALDGHLSGAVAHIVRQAGIEPLWRTSRSAEFMDWRFSRTPWYRYDFFLVHRDSEPYGYFVLKVFQDSSHQEATGDIVDLMCRQDDRDAVLEILSFVLEHFHAQGIERVETWLQADTLLHEVGCELGFEATAQERYFCCRVLDDRHRSLEDPKEWFVTMADSEIY